MRAPDFTLPDETGSPVPLKSLAGQHLIVFFYPKAMTPGCTTEACDFRDAYQELLDAGYQVIGISPDPPEVNARFKEKEDLPFSLLSDTQHIVADAFGAWGTKKNYGREYQGLIRSTFVIAPDLTIVRQFKNVRASGHVHRLTRELLHEQ